MKWLMYFEKFEGNPKKYDEVTKCIQKGGYIYATIVKNFPKNNPDEPLKPVSIDEDGLITVEYDGRNYEIDLNDVEKIEY